MNWFEKVERYYNEGFYTPDQVKKFVTAGKISQEECDQILGK